MRNLLWRFLSKKPETARNQLRIKLLSEQSETMRNHLRRRLLKVELEIARGNSRNLSGHCERRQNCKQIELNPPLPKQLLRRRHWTSKSNRGLEESLGDKATKLYTEHYHVCSSPSTHKQRVTNLPCKIDVLIQM